MMRFSQDHVAGVSRLVEQEPEVLSKAAVFRRSLASAEKISAKAIAMC
ncbi:MULTISPECIES: hypothetical protein [Sphingopyxis]|nr:MULTISPECIES: hypothetical protein [Sphingopyxis]